MDSLRRGRPRLRFGGSTAGAGAGVGAYDDAGGDAAASSVGVAGWLEVSEMELREGVRRLK